MTEAELQSAVLELLHLLGYRAMHTRPARTRSGWRTPLQGPTSPGWPDVFAVKGSRAIAAELKVGRNKPTPEQTAWLEALAAAGIETFVWTDVHWLAGTIEAALRPKAAA